SLSKGGVLPRLSIMSVVISDKVLISHSSGNLKVILSFKEPLIIYIPTPLNNRTSFLLFHFYLALIFSNHLTQPVYQSPLLLQWYQYSAQYLSCNHFLVFLLYLLPDNTYLYFHIYHTLKLSFLYPYFETHSGFYLPDNLSSHLK